MIQSVEFKSEDGIILAGNLYLPTSENKIPGVILAHMYQNNKQSWDSFARKLAEQGYAALAFDLRGWGDSGGTGAVSEMYLDVMAAANFLANFSRIDRDKITAVGASMGGMAAVIAASHTELIKGVVTICAPYSWQNTEPINYVQHISPRPLLVIAAANDAHLELRAAKMLYLKASKPKEWQVINTNRYGTDIFATEYGDQLSNLIFDFLKKHFQPEQSEMNE